MSQPKEEYDGKAQAPLASPGWYADPSGAGQRWWDGRSWGQPLVGAQSRQTDVSLPPTPAQERNWAMWSHLGALLVGVGALLLTAGTLSIFAFVFPLVVMNTVGAKSRHVRDHAVESLNFQLSILLYSAAILVLTIMIAVITLGLGLLVVVPAILVLVVLEVVAMIVASMQASDGRFFRYPLTIRFVH